MNEQYLYQISIFRSGPQWKNIKLHTMTDWCFRPRFCTVKAILARRQHGRMRILLWIMPLAQHRSLDLLASSPARYHWTTDAPLKLLTQMPRLLYIYIYNHTLSENLLQLYFKFVYICTKVIQTSHKYISNSTVLHTLFFTLDSSYDKTYCWLKISNFIK